jgi:hypothetical protein
MPGATDLDEETLSLIAAIRAEDFYDRVVELIQRLNDDLFDKFCAKPYLEFPDIGYCSFAAEGNCGYVNVIREVFETYGIDVIKKVRT